MVNVDEGGVYGDGAGGVFVYPFVVEAFGGFGDSACTILDLCAASYARKRKLPPQALSAVTRRWRASIGAAMYRAQASIFSAAHSETATGHAPTADTEDSEEEQID